MKDNDVILWQARFMATQASTIDQMYRDLDEAQTIMDEVETMRARVAELEGATAGQLQDHQRYVETIRRHEGTIESRVFELNEMRRVRNEQAEVIANLEAALADRDKRLNEARGASVAGLPLVAQPAAASNALHGMLSLIRQHDLTRAEILVYLYVLVYGKDGQAPPSAQIVKALRCDKGTPAKALKRLRWLRLVKPGAMFRVPSKALNGDAPTG